MMKTTLLLFAFVGLSATTTLAQNAKSTEPIQTQPALTEAEISLDAIKQFEAKIEGNKETIDYEAERLRLAKMKADHAEKYGVKPK